MQRGDWVAVRGLEARGPARILVATHHRVMVRWPLDSDRPDATYPRERVEITAPPSWDRDASTS